MNDERGVNNECGVNIERAVFAGGCFWGMQDLIRRYDGVFSTRVGYTGGDVSNATYRHHGTHAGLCRPVFGAGVFLGVLRLDFAER